MLTEKQCHQQVGGCVGRGKEEHVAIVVDRETVISGEWGEVLWGGGRRNTSC